MVIRLHGDLAIELQRHLPAARTHFAGRRWIVVHGDNRSGQRVGIAGGGDQAAAALTRDHGGLGALIGRRDVRATGGENPIDLARHDESLEAALQRHDEDVGR